MTAITRIITRRYRCPARLLPAIISAFLLLGVCRDCFSQSNEETVSWINTRGEELLKELTGNTTLQWELDGYGTLKITDYTPDGAGQSGLEKRYTYLNLYELDAEETSIQPTSPADRSKQLVLRCQEDKNGCIKSRNHYRESGSETRAGTSFRFLLRDTADIEKAARLEQGITRAIRLFFGESSDGDEDG